MSDAEPIQTQETKKIILRWGDWEEEDKAAFKPPLPATLKEWQGYGFNEATHRNSEEALNFFCQVTSDIAAANIMVNYCGVRTSIRGLFPVHYGLIDFGNARMFPADCPADRLFVSDLFTGRHSMAPEVRLRQPYDPFAADVYQTAVLFFSYFYDVTAYVPGFHEVLLAMAEKSLKPSDRITMAEAHRRFCELRRKAPPTHQHEPIDITFWNHIPPRADMDAALVRRYLLKWKQKMARSDVKRKNTGVVSDAIWNEDWPPMDSL
ncbi:hypothetical protein FISHEDRAFT_61593 [Fistulina hepatica ATCC 64428]|uniref:Protein kinase domain-containing protein n=1 Tax=Fistulina hepatica ATCC 64428 TaxID=1128425 RepID=A0A0D7A4T6_9AGAR|nr:hypothetical protein FISHEDRAFT_61593 [Fistulina hepatica ATCC 64428]